MDSSFIFIYFLNSCPKIVKYEVDNCIKEKREFKKIQWIDFCIEVGQKYGEYFLILADKVAGIRQCIMYIVQLLSLQSWRVIYHVSLRESLMARLCLENSNVLKYYIGVPVLRLFSINTVKLIQENCFFNTVQYKQVFKKRNTPRSSG